MKNSLLLNKILSDLKKSLEKNNESLSALPPGSLTAERWSYNGEIRIRYFHTVNTKNGRQRKVITNEPSIIKKLARKKYLETENRILQQNIKHIEKILFHYVSQDPEQILSCLPHPYQALDPSFFFDANSTDTAFSEWENGEYPKNTLFPEEKRHRTARGEKVRSKSEAIIANVLSQYQIPYRYEETLFIGRESFSPDFTIRKENGAFLYWEHCGLTGNPEYMARHKTKIDTYEKAGIYPWKNLIITYDDENGGIDIPLIEKEIQTRTLT